METGVRPGEDRGMSNLSSHFSRKELACRHCGALNVAEELVHALEGLREIAGSPVVVRDGYRCPEHNIALGKVAGSEHTLGWAADISIPGRTLQEMYELALRIPAFAGGGIGVYDKGYLHVDIRKGKSRWACVRGQYVGIQHLVRIYPFEVERRRARREATR
jgi:uncharacterized protein YcbK (DUF882 family)